jgi:cobalamin biosynthesis protein CobD/CbiB
MLAILVITGITLGFISFLRATLGMVMGVMMGLVLNRIQRLTWSRNARLVTATVDAVGILMLFLFVVLVSLRAFLALSFTSGLLESAVVGMSTATGVMFMRLRHLRREVQKIVEALAKED